MSTFLFMANEPALDFVNTEVVLGGVRSDLLQSVRDLSRWLAGANLVPLSESQALARKWAGTPREAPALEAARALRRALRSAAERVADSGRLPSGLAGVLARELRRPRLATEVASWHGRLKTKPRWVLEAPRDLLVPVAHHAALFFASADYSAIRKCEGPECILLFYDISKNHRRRWCSMDFCGNRAKVAAFRERR